MVVQPILSDTVVSFGEMKLRSVMSEGNYEMGKTEVDGAHIHSCYEIYINVTGDISFFHGSAVYDIRPFDAVVSYPGDVHHCIYRASCRHTHYCIWFQSDEVGAFLERRSIRGRVELSQGERERMQTLLQKLTQTKEDSFLRSAALMELLSMLDTESRTRTEVSDDFPAQINEMLGYIDAHLTDISGWEALSREFFISKSTINRMFKKYVGISAGRLIEAKRLSYAEKLLRADVSVTDACYRAGFSDCSRFISAFRKKFGLTPLKYKQGLRK
ncbi:MAG: helix-turn-helix transcriptional regulator [Clostridia bacterium]|nr:helix-turn-helix transcriptional regulator [Clostridia bacterium]